MAKYIERRHREVEDDACDMIVNGSSFDAIGLSMGIGKKTQFANYLIQYPEFAEKVNKALLAQCMFLEEDMLHVVDNYQHHYAKVQMEAIAKILKYRDPKRYGDKVQMDMTVSVDIAGALDRAEKRVLESSILGNIVQLNPPKNEV